VLDTDGGFRVLFQQLYASRIARFAVVGVIATVVHYTVALLSSTVVSVYWSNLSGYLAAVAISYVGHQRFTFGVSVKDISHMRQFPRFITTSLGGLALSFLVLSLMTDYWRAPPWLALGAAVTLVPLYTFVISKLWVFRIDSKKNSETPFGGGLVQLPGGLGAIAHLLLIFAAMLLFFPWFLDESQQHLHLYNSDVIQPFLLVADLFRDPGALFTWYHSPAPYVVPDWLLSGMLVAMGWPGKTLPLLYAGTIFTLYAFAGGYSLSVGTRVLPSVAAWLVATVLVACGLIILWFKIPHISAFIYVSMGAPFIHTGALLLSLMSSGLFLRSLQVDSPRSPFVLLLIIVILGSFSDMIFVVWFVLPAMLTGSLYYWVNRRRRTIGVIGGVGLAALVGHLLEGALHPVRQSYMAANERSVTESWEWLVRHGHMAVTDRDYPTLFVLVLCALLLLRGVALAIGSFSRRDLSQKQWLEMLFAGMVAAGLLAPIAAGMLGQFSTVRYWMIACMLAPLWGMLSVLDWLHNSNVFMWRYTRLVLRSTALVGLAVFLSVFLPRGMETWKRMAVDHSLVSCLEGMGLDAGLSDYWNAKLLMLLSNGRLHLIQISSDGIPWRWNTNEAWLNQRTDIQAEPDFHFILPQNLDEGTLQRTYGKPQQIARCDGQAVWVYERSISWHTYQ
jgi:putative flippase GtrA